jgi:hypothetical protein
MSTGIFSPFSKYPGEYLSISKTGGSEFNSAIKTYLNSLLINVFCQTVESQFLICNFKDSS